MAVQIDGTRKAVNISWDTDIVQGEEVEIIATNPNDLDDISTRVVRNDGYAVLTYPADYSGESQIIVTGEDEGEDTGTIAV